MTNEGIPFELWSDICEEGWELLKKLLQDPTIVCKELEGFRQEMLESFQ